jgi:chemotaxis response regulator CheB
MLGSVPSTVAASPCSYSLGIVAVVASAGGIPALIELLCGLDGQMAFPIIIAQHLARNVESILPAILSWHTGCTAEWARQGERPKGGIVYVVPPRCSVEVHDYRFDLKRLPDEARSWLGVPDRLLQSISENYGSSSVAVTLSGMLPVGVAGLRAIRLAGGITIAQNERTSEHFELPRAAIDLGKADIIFSPRHIADALSVISEQRVTNVPM